MKVTRWIINAALIIIVGATLSGCATPAQQPSGDYVYCHGMKRPPGWICADGK